MSFTRYKNINSTISDIKGVSNNSNTRARWQGHSLYAENNVSVEPSLTVKEGHDIADDIRHKLLHNIQHLSYVAVHINPADARDSSKK